jgi:hypothetical protein
MKKRRPVSKDIADESWDEHDWTRHSRWFSKKEGSWKDNLFPSCPCPQFERYNEMNI